jgi:CheY-like chemotaxis protein
LPEYFTPVCANTERPGNVTFRAPEFLRRCYNIRQMPEGGCPPTNLILAADDEAIVLRVITTALSSAGYRAEVVTNGAAGVQKFRELRDQICLVVVDVVMPIMGGIRMAEEIRQIDPAAKILFMSGYSDAAQEVQARRNYPFIRKPFLPADLIHKISEVLAQSQQFGAGAGQP